jgi:hypothetical protein
MDFVVCKWCLAALLCVSLWSIGSAIVCPPDPALASQDGSSSLAVPSNDDAPERHWAAPRTAACLTGSAWTSQARHAVLAGSPSHDVLRAPRAGDESARLTPRVLRPQIQTPLLI